MQSRKTSTSRLLSFLFTLLVLGGFFFIFLQRQAIFDWYKLRDYTPPAAVSQLATDTTMTGEARHMFFVFHPDLIQDKATFNQRCPHYEQTIVLGCYVSNRGIYLYDVQDPRLQGVKQVTAAHEMLHVGYQRLSRSERKRVDEVLQEAYAQVTDARIRSTIESYQKDGADVNNELHSILGTEVAALPPELEAYYKQYFTDRAVVVSFAMAYEKEFSSREQRVADYDARLAGLKTQINANEMDLEVRATQLEAERRRLDGLLAAKNYQPYNAGVITFNASVQQYNALVATTRTQIDEYNRLVNERNQLALEQRNLAQSLDSRPEPQQTQ